MPAESKVAEELRILTAPLVTEKAKRKEKPKTAKEALRAKAEQNRGSRAPAKRVAKTPPRENAQRDEETSDTERDEDEVVTRRAPPSVWERVKRFFAK